MFCYVLNSLLAASKQVSASPPKAVKADIIVKKETKKVKREETPARVKTEKGEVSIGGDCLLTSQNCLW